MFSAEGWKSMVSSPLFLLRHGLVSVNCEDAAHRRFCSLTTEQSAVIGLCHCCYCYYCGCCYHSDYYLCLFALLLLLLECPDVTWPDFISLFQKLCFTKVLNCLIGNEIWNRALKNFETLNCLINIQNLFRNKRGEFCCCFWNKRLSDI